MLAKMDELRVVSFAFRSSVTFIHGFTSSILCKYMIIKETLEQCEHRLE